MAKYRLAILPGDGTGKEVIEAAMIVLKRLNLDADYIYGDIGWEFWCREGNPLPDRTIKLLKETDACLFGAITSKPKEDAAKELAPEFQGKGLSYVSPIVKLRQLFDLYINLRPCKAYAGNPLNYRDNIDLVIFRENTEGSYAGVEFFPLPEEVRQALLLHPKMKDFKDVPAEEIAVSTRIMTKKGCQRIVKAAFEYARQYKRKSVTLVEKPNVLRETGGLMLREARKIAAEYPDIKFFEANVDAMCMWLVKILRIMMCWWLRIFSAISFLTWLLSWSVVLALPVPVISEIIMLFSNQLMAQLPNMPGFIKLTPQLPFWLSK